MYNCLTYIWFVTDIFEISIEVIDIQRGKRVRERIFSTILWPTLQQKLSEILNIYSASLHAQYRLSTDAKGSLPFDLTSSQDLRQLVKIIQPLVVPPRLANGKRSKKRMKEVIVSVSQKGDSADFQAAKSGAKVSQMFVLNPQG